MRKKKERFFLEINNRKVPVEFTWERRRNVRFAFGQKAILVRFPLVLDRNQERRHLQRLRAWVEQHMAKQNGLLDHLAGKNYKTGDQIQVGNRTYELKIQQEDRKSISAKQIDGIIHIKWPQTADELAIAQKTKRLLSKVIGQDFLPEIRQRVEAINRKHFKKTIKDIHLRYHSSSWGKCSASGEIILSTRLLFAPEEVIDYVIIHELAHLEVFDHSPKFWNLVAKAMPTHKEKQAWLREHYFRCDF